MQLCPNAGATQTALGWRQVDFLRERGGIIGNECDAPALAQQICFVENIGKRSPTGWVFPVAGIALIDAKSMISL